MMRKSVLMITLSMLIAGILSACGHQHSWEEATCTAPRTCTECGETDGEKLEHDWIDATCTAPKTCSVCGKTRGDALEHDWIDATCTTPKTCSICGETDGEASEHDWIDATCTTPKTCSICGETDGEASEHDWIDATCTTPKTCSVCGVTEGALAEHDLDSTGKCTVCSAQIGYALNSSNYNQYLNITFKLERIDAPYDIWPYSEKLTVTVEPIKNVNFENVCVNYVYTEHLSYYYLINGKHFEDQERTGSVRLDSAGYGSASSSSSVWIKNYRFIAISGYVIE